MIKTLTIILLAVLSMAFTCSLENLIVDKTGSLQNYLNIEMKDISDNFDNNALSTQWTVYECNSGEGTVTETSNQLILTADGGDMWTTSDQYTVAYFTSVGDFDFSLKVGSATNGTAWTKYGLMTKNSMELSANSTGYALIADTNEEGFTFQYDSDNDGYLDTENTVSPSTTPSWIRLIKKGSTISGYYSTDGNNWDLLGSYTDASVSSSADIGIFLCDNEGSGVASIDIDDFKDSTVWINTGRARDYTQLNQCDWAFLMDSLTLTDETGNYIVTVGEDISLVNGEFDNALDFNSSSTSTIVFNSSYTPPKQGTIVFWITCDAVNTLNDKVFGAHNTYEVRVSPDFDKYTISSDLFSLGKSSNTKLDFGTRYHIAMTWDSNTGHTIVYINGIIDSDYSDLAQTPPGSNLFITIGPRTNTTAYFNGKLDELAEFNIVLTPFQINQIRTKGLKGLRV